MSYLYYLIYKFTLLTPSKNEQPEHIANMVLALILCFTLFAIINILDYFNINIFFDIWKNKMLFIAIYLSFIVFGYFIFIRNKRYISLRKKFDSESKKRKIRNIVLISSYLISLIIINFTVN